MADDGIPRYENPRFLEREADGPDGMPCYHGGKLIDGVIHYPEGARIDKASAARVQAFVDYSYRPGNTPTPNEALAQVYGKPYQERFEQLKKQKIIRRVLDGVLHHMGKFYMPE